MMKRIAVVLILCFMITGLQGIAVALRGDASAPVVSQEEKAKLLESDRARKAVAYEPLPGVLKPAEVNKRDMIKQARSGEKEAKGSKLGFLFNIMLVIIFIAVIIYLYKLR